MADDAAVFLRRAGEEARHIFERDERDVEGVAETNEPRGLHRSIDVETSGENGRLIRDETDRGVLMICDPRLINKHYGKRIWRSLPPMKRTRALDEVIAFFGN